MARASHKRTSDPSIALKDAHTVSTLELQTASDIRAFLKSRRNELKDTREIPLKAYGSFDQSIRQPTGAEVDVTEDGETFGVSWQYNSQAFHISKNFAKRHGSWNGTDWIIPNKYLGAFKTLCADNALVIRDIEALIAERDARVEKQRREAEEYDHLYTFAMTLISVSPVSQSKAIISADFNDKTADELRALEVFFSTENSYSYYAAITPTSGWKAPSWLPVRVDSSQHPGARRVRLPVSPPIIAAMRRDRLRADVEFDFQHNRHIAVAAEILDRLGKRTRHLSCEDAKRLVAADLLFDVSVAMQVQVSVQMPEPFVLDAERRDGIPGWTRPTHANDKRLMDHQKSLVEFLVERNGCGLCGDEMGTGKTAGAVATAQALNARKIISIIPVSVASQWSRDIAEFSNGDQKMIQLTAARHDDLPSADGWVGVTYDAIIDRTKSLKCATVEEARLIDHWARLGYAPGSNDNDPDDKEDIDDAESDSDATTASSAAEADDPSRLRVKLPATRRCKANLTALLESKNFKKLSGKTVKSLKKIFVTLINPLRLKLLEWGPDMIVIDEAHRAKNPSAARTKAIVELAEAASYRVALSGTFLRNVPEDVNAIADIVTPGLRADLNDFFPKASRVDIARKILDQMMIRRRKEDVLRDLPPLSRQTLTLPFRDIAVSDEYLQKMNEAEEAYYQAFVASSGDAFAARQAAMGHWSTARNILGQIKVKHPETMEILTDALDETGCLVVFAHHEAARNYLCEQFKRRKLRVAQLSGKTAPRDRTDLIDGFQERRIDVLIISTLAAGEGITLTRAKTVHFLELDWVPANLLQAEARIHRKGQESRTTAYHVLADFEADLVPPDLNLDLIMADRLISKQTVINEILNENQEVLSTGPSQSHCGPGNSNQRPDPDYDANETALDVLVRQTHQRTLARIAATPKDETSERPTKKAPRKPRTAK